MNINVLSKYIILFFLAVIVVLSVLLAVYSAENKALQKANAVLKEQVSLRDAAIGEMDKNIASLQEQVKEAESICNERLKARNDLLTFLSIESAYDVGKEKNSSFKINALGSKKDVVALHATTLKQIYSSASPHNDKGGIYEVISKNKSDYAVNAINSYWVQFTQSSYNKK